MLSLARKKNLSNNGDTRPPCTGNAVDLSWVDEFIDNIRPYVRAREQDSVLIKLPNQVFHLNDSGVRIMSFLLAGGGAADLLDTFGEDKATDIVSFIEAVKRCLEGTLRETDASPAVKVRPLAINFTSLPVLAEIAISRRCNLRCKFCYAGCPRTGGGSRKDEMSRAQVKRVIDRIYHEAHVPSLSFTGGEPTLRHDLPELVAYAAGIKGMRVNLITNGTLVTPSLADTLKQAGLASAQVSIEGINPATHDAITTASGSFERSIGAIKNLRDAGIHVHANTTMNRMNLTECSELPRLAATLGLDRFSMNLVIPSGSAAKNSDLLLRYSEVGPVLEAVIAASERHSLEFMWYSPTPLCLFNPIIHRLGNKGCSACDGLLSVDAAGNVLPCSSFQEPVGNLLADNFIHIWDSIKARLYRAKSLAHQGCRECDSFAACHGACPLYWRHFGFRELFQSKSNSAHTGGVRRSEGRSQRGADSGTAVIGKGVTA